MKKRFILVRQGAKNDDRFPKVVIHDTSETVPAVIGGRLTRTYKPVSGVLDYLDAYPIAKSLNDPKIS